MFFFIILMFAGGMFESLYTYLTMSSQRTNPGATSALMGAARWLFRQSSEVSVVLIELNTSIWMMYLLLIILIMIYMLKKYQTLTVTGSALNEADRHCCYKIHSSNVPDIT